MRRLAVVLASVAIVAAFFVASPAALDASCSQAKVVLWEHSNFNGNSLTICYPTNVPDLPGWPDAGVPGPAGWGDDAVSSIQYFESINTSVCVFLNQYYGGQIIFQGFNNGQTVQWEWWHSPMNDGASSVKWGDNCHT